jgi:trimethylamine:corrinoid methyltransferase-like protein
MERWWTNDELQMERKHLDLTEAFAGVTDENYEKIQDYGTSADSGTETVSVVLGVPEQERNGANSVAVLCVCVSQPGRSARRRGRYASSIRQEA